MSHLDTQTPPHAAMVGQLAASAQALQAPVQGTTDSMRLFRLERSESTVAERDAVGLLKAGSGRRSSQAPDARAGTPMARPQISGCSVDSSRLTSAIRRKP